MSLAGRYAICRANATARPFVVRAEKVRAGWIVLSRFGTYPAAVAELGRLLA